MKTCLLPLFCCCWYLQVTINFLGFPVFFKKSSQHSLSTHPNNLHQKNAVGVKRICRIHHTDYFGQLVSVLISSGFYFICETSCFYPSEQRDRARHESQLVIKEYVLCGSRNIPVCLPHMQKPRWWQPVTFPRVPHQSFSQHHCFWVLRTHTFWGIRALAVPFLLPVPVCLPLRRAIAFSLTLAREWTATGFLMIKPSLISFLMFCPASYQEGKCFTPSRFPFVNQRGQCNPKHHFCGILTRVRIGDLIRFVRIQPDFVFTALEDGGCEPLLQPKSTAKTPQNFKSLQPRKKPKCSSRGPVNNDTNRGSFLNL